MPDVQQLQNAIDSAQSILDGLNDAMAAVVSGVPVVNQPAPNNCAVQQALDDSAQAAVDLAVSFRNSAATMHESAETLVQTAEAFKSVTGDWLMQCLTG